MSKCVQSQLVHLSRCKWIDDHEGCDVVVHAMHLDDLSAIAARRNRSYRAFNYEVVITGRISHERDSAVWEIIIDPT